MFTHFPWQLNICKRNHQRWSIVGSISWDVSGVPVANEELYSSRAELCTVGPLLRDSWCMSPRACPLFPWLFNVRLICSCWAWGCIGTNSTLTASITQRASLAPFKIYLKGLVGATDQPDVDAAMLVCYYGQTVGSILGQHQVYWKSKWIMEPAGFGSPLACKCNSSSLQPAPFLPLSL